MGQIKLLFLIGLLNSCIVSAQSNLYNYVHSCVDSNGNFDADKAYSFLPKYSYNIYLLSEIDHRFDMIESIRTDLAKKIIISDKPEEIFYENTWEHDSLLRNYIKGAINIKEYRDTMKSKYYLPQKLGIPDSINFPYYEDLQREYADLSKDKYISFLKNIDDIGYLNKLVAIDIGTQTMWLGLFHLSKITKLKNLKNDMIINEFLDSIRVRYRWDFSNLALSLDSQDDYLKHKTDIDKFIEALNRNINDPILITAWESVFASFKQANAFRTLSQPVAFGGKALTLKEIVIKNSFRDSILYNNFTFFLPEKWRNIVILFSTYHLMNIEESGYFSDIIDSSTRTLGKYLQKAYKPYLRRIAFICYKGMENHKEYSKDNYKKSIEYYLAQHYDYAYVDLLAYRNSSEEKKPFYMRPTFYNYRKLNWEDLFDGIIFSTKCYCDKN